MGYILFPFLLALAIVLQPLQVVIGLITRWLWRPPALSEEMLSARRDGVSLRSRYDKAVGDLDREWLRKHWDAGKFLSMFSWATGEQWADVMSMADEQAKTLHRNPSGFWKESEKTFSGDQLAGWMGAVADRIVRVGLSREETRKMSLVWQNISFGGWPMLIPHFVTGRGFKLGFVWRPWQIWNCAGIVKLMTWLMLGRHITGKRRYAVMFYAVYVLFLPALLLASPDGEVFLGRCYACSANASHSLMLDLASGYMLRGSWIFRFLMKRLGKKRSAWSADWLALWGRYFGTLTVEQETRLEYLVQSTAAKSAGDNADLTREYIDLVHFEKHDGFPVIETPEKRFCDYTDERNVVVPENWWNHSMPACKTAVDVIFPAGIFLGKK